MLVFVDQLNVGVEQPVHLVAEPGVLAAAGAVDAQRSHELRERRPQDQLAGLGAHRLSTDPRQQQARHVAVGKFVVDSSSHPQFVGAVAVNIPKPVAGVGARQRAQRHQSRHEAHVRVRFAGPDELVHLVSLGEVMVRRATRDDQRAALEWLRGKFAERG